MKYQKLKEYAINHGICYMTAYRHFKKGLIPNQKIIGTCTMVVGIPDILEVKEEVKERTE